MNLQNVYDLSNDTIVSNSLIARREPRTPNSPPVPAVDPDFLSGHSHSPRVRSIFGYLSKIILNGRTRSGAAACATVQTVVTAGGGAFWRCGSRGRSVDVGAWAEVGRGDRVVVVESECGWWVVIGTGVRSFAENVGQDTKNHDSKK